MAIPAEVTARHGVIQEDVFRHGPDAKGIDDACVRIRYHGARSPEHGARHAENLRRLERPSS